MRIAGIYGGSFDPIHRGHVEPVLFAASELGLDEVVYVPAARPPHKPDGAAASAFHRFAMAALATAPHPELSVDDFELRRGGSTYTIDTLAHYRRARPEEEIVLVLGSDSVATFATWHRWEEIARTTKIAVLVREPWGREATAAEVPPSLAARFAPPGARLRDVAEGTIVWSGNAPVTISSTWLRSALREGNKEAKAALPPAVASHLAKHALYDAPRPLPPPPAAP